MCHISTHVMEATALQRLQLGLQGTTVAPTSTEHIFCESQVQTMAVVIYTCDPLEKYNVYNKARPSPPGYSSTASPSTRLGDALQPYKELTWEHGYTWKQQKAIDVMRYMPRPNNDRHHVLIGQCLQEHAGHAMKYYKNNGRMVSVNKILDYTFTHHVDVHMKDDKMEQHPGHPGFPAYIRNKLLHVAIFNNPTEDGNTAMDAADEEQG